MRRERYKVEPGSGQRKQPRPMNLAQFSKVDHALNSTKWNSVIQK